MGSSNPRGVYAHLWAFLLTLLPLRQGLLPLGQKERPFMAFYEFLFAFGVIYFCLEGNDTWAPIK